MRVLVIGGAGYVGRMVLPGLAARHQVRVLDLVAPPAGGHELLTGDATDPSVLARACADTDAVLHMAMAPTSPDSDTDPVVAFDVHVKSAYLTVRAAAAAGARHVVFVSSMSVFDELGFRTIGTDEEPDATDPYGLTKRLGEQACRAAAQETGTALDILRLCWPTPDEMWPAWEFGLRQQPFHTHRDGRPGLYREPVSATEPLPMMRMGDGRAMAALAGSDLATALLAVLDRPAEGVRALPMTGDAAGACTDLSPTMAALDWSPRR